MENNITPIDFLEVEGIWLQKEISLVGLIKYPPEILFPLETFRYRKLDSNDIGVVVYIEKSGGLTIVAIRHSKLLAGSKINKFGFWGELKNLNVGDYILFQFKVLNSGNFRLEYFLNYREFKNQAWYYDFSNIDFEKKKYYFDITGKNKYKFDGLIVDGYYTIKFGKKIAEEL